MVIIVEIYAWSKISEVDYYSRKEFDSTDDSFMKELILPVSASIVHNGLTEEPNYIIKTRHEARSSCLF